MEVGDRVTIHAKIRSIVAGYASLFIPTYNFPHSIPAPPKAKVRHPVDLTGIVERVDGADVTVALDLGGVVTLKEEGIASFEPGDRREFTGRDRVT